MDIGLANYQWSQQLIASLVSSGITRFVISPGSRSTPLTLAVSRNRDAQHWLIIDERDAAFFALGQSKVDKIATALICTSGSAVANWLPAVVEANHSATPLLLLSADRPPELHNCGANQTIQQHNIFGAEVRFNKSILPPDEIKNSDEYIQQLVDTLIGKLGSNNSNQNIIPGPLHLNIPFREPLLPSTLPPEISAKPIQENIALNELPIPTYQIKESAEIVSIGAGLIICGEAIYNSKFPLQLQKISKQLNVPILADSLSNLRWRAQQYDLLITNYDAVSEEIQIGVHIEWIIQFGKFPLSSSLNRYLHNHPPKKFITIQHRQLWSDPLSLSTKRIEIEPALFCSELYSELKENQHSPAVNSTQQLLTDNLIKLNAKANSWSIGKRSSNKDLDLLSEQAILQSIKSEIPADGVLFSANSMAIRDIDCWLGKRSKPLKLFANRGASGIDGNLATLCGIRSVIDSDTPLVALLGDITIFHNLNALYIAQQIKGNTTIIILNNGGGNIFSQLPPAKLPEFKELWLTPTNLDFKKAAALYNIEYQKNRDAN